ncbi:hypothetical protein MMC20_003633 [Loxospora ochrophaea]|nr:hypothetical protein [Loxospora ochrophaea]
MVSVIWRMRKLRNKVSLSSKSACILSVAPNLTSSLHSQLLAIRLGPGAAVLPQTIKRIHLDFAYKIDDGHLGPRHFWRIYLPRLKYHNPAVSMTVNRTTDQSAPATLSVFFAAPRSSDRPTASPAPSESTSGAKAPELNHAIFERVESIDMKYKQGEEIWDRFLRVTRAIIVEATPEERKEMGDLEEQRVRSEEDRRQNAEVLERKRREQALLDQARGRLTEGA